MRKGCGTDETGLFTGPMALLFNPEVWKKIISRLLGCTSSSALVQVLFRLCIGQCIVISELDSHSFMLC